jgi:hypothetical protein
VIPGYILDRPLGSRGDVDAAGTWQEGRWVVVLRRALDTEHKDDVVFVPQQALPFGVAVLDNAGDTKHKVAELVMLEWQ